MSFLITFFLSNSCRQKDKHLYEFSPMRPLKIELPVSHDMFWRYYIDCLIVNKVTVTLKESNLSMFNDTSIVEYNVSGHISVPKNCKPILSAAHLTQTINKDSKKTISGSIEITPVLRFDVADGAPERMEAFTFSNEMYLLSSGWGENTYVFRSMNKYDTIKVFQNK